MHELGFGSGATAEQVTQAAQVDRGAAYADAMTYVDEFAGYEITDWNEGDALGDVTTWIPNVLVEYDDGPEDWDEVLDALLATEGSEKLQGLSIGLWGEPYEVGSDEVLRSLTAAADRLPELRVLVVGNMDSEECEISWIVQSDLGPELNKLPGLEHLMVIGGTHLNLTGLDLPNLKTLHVETGGLSRSTVVDIMQAKLPALTHLEIYTGDEYYGAESTVDDLAPLLEGRVHTGLTHLAIANCEYADAVAEKLKDSPVLDHVKVLDLSQGAMRDVGGQALLDNPRLGNLESLDLSHHYFSDEMMGKLRRHLPCEVDVSDQQDPFDFDPDGNYSVAIGE